MKRIWMWGIFAMLIASIPSEGWAQNGTVRVFTRGTETITVTEVTPSGFTAGVGRTLVVVIPSTPALRITCGFPVI